MSDTVFHPLRKIGDPVQQGVMTLIVVKDKDVVPIGTGFTITPDGLLVTAVHVIHEAEKRALLQSARDGSTDLQLEFYALYITPKRQADGDLFGGLLPIHKVWLLDGLDVGYCLISPPLINNERLRFPVFRLSPGLPNVGENVIGFGYHRMAGTIQGTSESGQTKVSYTQETAFTRGQIVGVFPERRDSAMLKFPCFHTNARFEAGMSGGPILNERGSVCGVICSSFPPVEDDPEYISYASLLYPALGTPIEVAQHPGSAPERMSVYDVIRKGLILTDDTFADISIQEAPGGLFNVSIRL